MAKQEKRPLTEEEKAYIDKNRATVTIIQLMAKFKRTNGKKFYDYYDLMGYIPYNSFDRRAGNRVRREEAPDGFFKLGSGGDWLTGPR